MYQNIGMRAILAHNLTDDVAEQPITWKNIIIFHRETKFIIYNYKISVINYIFKNWNMDLFNDWHTMYLPN